MNLPAKGDRVYLPARFGMLAGYVGRVASVDGDWAMVDLGDYGEIGCPVGDLIPEAAKTTAAQ